MPTTGRTDCHASVEPSLLHSFRPNMGLKCAHVSYRALEAEARSNLRPHSCSAVTVFGSIFPVRDGPYMQEQKLH